MASGSLQGSQMLGSRWEPGVVQLLAALFCVRQVILLHEVSAMLWCYG